jgi:DNA-binding LacI/PurR family transcriptional regulator
VVVGGPAGTGGLPAVWNDEDDAVEAALLHLVGLGHRRVGRVSGPEPLLHTRRRGTAFQRLAAEHGVHGRTVATDYSGEQGATATRRLLDPDRRDGGLPPTALIYDNDVMAIAGLAAVQAMGLRVPQDVSLVAWDDSPLCRLVRPSLTALSRDVAGHGSAAAKRLRAVVEDGATGDVRCPSATLQPRESSGPAPTHD